LINYQAGTHNLLATQSCIGEWTDKTKIQFEQRTTAEEFNSKGAASNRRTSADAARRSSCCR
jgi:hypothetical protein